MVRIFEKCDESVNGSYWELNYDSKFFYTNFDPCDEMDTLDQVMKMTKLRQYREGLVSDYFEKCLYSYITKENPEFIKHLLSVDGFNLGDVNIKSQNSVKQSIEDGIIEINDLDGLTPALLITYNSNKTVIETYHGSNAIIVKSKFQEYAKTPSVRIFISNRC